MMQSIIENPTAAYLIWQIFHRLFRLQNDLRESHQTLSQSITEFIVRSYECDSSTTSPRSINHYIAPILAMANRNLLNSSPSEAWLESMIRLFTCLDLEGLHRLDGLMATFIRNFTQVWIFRIFL